MKKRIAKTIVIAILCMGFFTSCYTTTSTVGSGAVAGMEKTQWNHFVVAGLAPINVKDSKELAGSASNYTVKTSQTFICGLISFLTAGIYTPTITTVTVEE